MEKPTTYIYDTWVSHTCWVCRQISGPHFHATRRAYTPTSPCDTVTLRFIAHNRKSAIRMLKIWWNAR